MNEIKESVIKLLDMKEWPYLQNQELIKIDIDGKNGTWPSFVKCEHEEKILLYYSVFPVRIPKEKIDIVINGINQINYGLKIGNFELSYDQGELHFKTAIEFPNTDIDYIPFIEKIVITNILTTDEYMPVIMKLIHSDVKIEELGEIIK